jgi:hypothetical protein
MALEVILRLDEAQEFRQLSPEEQTLRKRLKLRVQGLAAIERARRPPQPSSPTERTKIR